MRSFHLRRAKYNLSFENYQEWFAWYPVTVDGNVTVWWENVWRKRESDWGDITWIYALEKPEKK